MGKLMGGILGGKDEGSGKPTPPPTIDPNTVINANANANRYNWNTPTGSRGWTKNADGTWTVNDSLNPTEQANYDANQTLNSGVTAGAQSAVNNYNAQDPNAMMTLAGGALPGSSYQGWQMASTGAGGGGGGAGANASANTNVDYSKLPGLISSLDTSKLDPLNTDFSAITDKARQAIYDKTTGLLKPDFEKQQRATEDQLANMGLVMGSEAYNEAKNRLDSQQNQAYERAGLDATINSGNLAQQLFGMNLAGRQQGVDELMKNAGLASGARGQYAGELDSNANRNVQTNIAGLNANTSAGIANMNNMTAMRGQDLSRLNQLDQSELARRSQIMGANGQQFSQLAGLLAGARGGQGQLNFGNPGQLDINGAYNIGQNSANSNYQAQQNQYNTDQQNQQQQNQQLMQLAMMMMGSDRALKTAVLAVGRAVNGLMVYVYRYLAGGPFHAGFMADEVKAKYPHAVKRIGAYEFVNYSLIG